MTVFAVGLVMFALVCFLRHSAKVLGIYTECLLAYVMHVIPTRNGSNKMLISNAMSRVAATNRAEDAIPFTRLGSSPDPTATHNDVLSFKAG